MKKPFNTDGVYGFQQELLSASEELLQLQIQRVRCDFKNFILDNFDFSESQLQQIANISSQDSIELGTAIADSWALGQPVNFQKDSPMTQKDTKDIILSGPNNRLTGPALIRIRYNVSEAISRPSEPDATAGDCSQIFRLS
ncbi:MAG: hypothetical protein LBJ04_17685 [Sphingobacterium sp.]|jgi:hypothetical protein|nr:hypothetical protein [Sphingobacterium sp.]